MGFGVNLSDKDIADFEVLSDVAMATVFDFLNMGCALAPPGEYDSFMCGGDAALCQITLTTCFSAFTARCTIIHSAVLA